MTSPERIVFTTDLVAVGLFRCPPDHEAFPGGMVNDHLVVFPRTAVRIERERTPPVLADPTVAVLYEPQSPYRRYLVDPRGDLCDFFAVDAAIAGDLTAAVVGANETPFERGHRRAHPAVYLAQRRLVRMAAESGADPLAVEEGVIAMVEALFASAGDIADTAQRPRRVSTATRHRDLALAVAELLAASYAEPLLLRDIARQVGSAPHHLSRIFRRETDTSIHRRLLELRLRHALERLQDDDGDLARIALELGFSSHSHFSRAFKTAFGVTPSTYRTETPQTRTIVQALAS